MTKSTKRMSLTTMILVSLVLGLVVGVIINLAAGGTDGFINKYIINGVFLVCGKIFISSIKMMVVPLVTISLIVGVTGIGDISKLGRVGGKTLFLYLLTTGIAVSLALVIAKLIGPGIGLDISTASAAFTGQEAPGFAQVLVDIIPTNPVQAMADANMLQIIFFSLLAGIAIASLGKKAEKVIHIMNEANEIVMTMVTIVMLFAPIGVFCLIAKVFAEQGLSALLPLIKYMLTVLIVLAVHLIVVYSGALRFIGGLSVKMFFKKFYSAILVAFSTASSNATIPVTMKTVIEKLGVSRSIASFSIPFGATINMDGTAIMQGVAVIFISQVYGVHLTSSDFLLVIATATLASIGTAGVPGVGLITLSMVLTQVHLPVEGIALIIGVDRLLDMSRTVVNISGDAIVSILVAKSEGELCLDTYNDPDAGNFNPEELVDEIEDNIHTTESLVKKDQAKIQNS